MSNGWHRKRMTPAEVERRKKYASPEHRAARKAIDAAQAAGRYLTCWRCRRPITPTQRCVVGHDDVQVQLIRGPEHHDCNKRAADSKGARVANAKRKGWKPRPTGSSPLRW